MYGEYKPLLFLKDKKIQAWKDWDGFGTYKYVRHDLPRNITNRDFQKRRILKKFGEDRLRVNVLRHGDMLPKVYLCTYCIFVGHPSLLLLLFTTLHYDRPD